MRKPGLSDDAPPVMLQHGLINSADVYLSHRENSIAIQLANQGYDVWLTNSRGSKYSRKHVKYDADTDPEFWNFSFVEMGQFDLPAFIEHILEKTGK